MDSIRLSIDDITELARDCLTRHGCNDENATAVADVVALAERDGAHSHGLMRMGGYVAALDSGKVNGHAQPGVEQLAPAVVRVDGNGGFAPLALRHGRPHLIDTARKTGIAAMPLINIHHFAALWTEVEPVAAAGLCAMACTSYKPAVIPAGGSKALYGTNPFAFGWPRRAGPPMVFDQASSVMARGEVTLAAREGRELPPGVGVDANGKLSQDPNEVLAGALLAFGGHKGSSIAMMVELLAGSLIGECFSFEAATRDNDEGGPPQGGELLIAMNPDMFGDQSGWAIHAEKLFDEITAQDGVRLPGDRRYQNRAVAARAGVDVPRATYEQILEL